MSNYYIALKIPLLLLVLASSVAGCLSDYPEVPFPSVTTETVQPISATAVIVTGLISEPNPAAKVAVGFCLATTTEFPTLADRRLPATLQPDGRLFTASVSGLDPDSTYFLRAYAQWTIEGQMRTAYGQTQVVMSPGVSLVLEDELSLASRDITLVGRALGLDNSLTLSHHGFAWSTASEQPTIADDTTDLGELISSDIFLDRITTWENGVTYWVRPFGQYTFNGEARVVYGESRRIRLEDLWQEQQDSPRRRRYASAFNYGGQAFVFGGLEAPLTESALFYADIDAFDPATNQWSGFKDNATVGRRHSAVAFVLDDYVYIGTGKGENGQTYEDFYKSKIALGSPNPANVPNPIGARYGAVSFVIDGTAYVGLGFDAADQPLSDFWSFRPDADPQWSPVSQDRISARGYATVFVIDGRAYLGTGTDRPSGGTAYQDFYVFDPQNTTAPWQPLDDFPGPARHSAAGFAVGGRGYIGTGYNPSATVLRDLWEYRPAEGWRRRAELKGNARVGAVGVTVGDRGYLGLGASELVGLSGEFVDWWAYIPEL